MVDVLSDVLHSLRLKNSLYCRSVLGAPWSLRFAAARCPVFHLVDQGTCWLHMAGQPAPIALASGDVVVLARGTEHVITSESGMPPFATITLDAEVPTTCLLKQHLTGGPVTTLICGIFDPASRSAQPLFALFPDLLHLPAEGAPHAAPLAATSHALYREATEGLPGSSILVGRLTDILCIQIVRAWLADPARGTGGWLGALNHPHIGRALALMHTDPQRGWTVASLAAAVALSRSAFAALFRQLVGESPQRYLTTWRLHCAARLIQDEHLPLRVVAQRSGYASEAAFSKAFKRHFGMPPGAYA